VTLLPESSPALFAEVDTDRKLADEFAPALIEGKLSCRAAFTVAKKHNIAPRVVGRKADKLNVKIISCQLGCFRRKYAANAELGEMQIAPGVEKAIRASTGNGRLPCKTAFDVAEKLKVSRQRVGAAAFKLNIRIADCQLGCF
jgi:hypothetical protein